MSTWSLVLEHSKSHPVSDSLGLGCNLACMREQTSSRYVCSTDSMYLHLPKVVCWQCLGRLGHCWGAGRTAGASACVFLCVQRLLYCDVMHAAFVPTGHDPNDYEIGKRVGLPTINIMNKDGSLNAAAGD